MRPATRQILDSLGALVGTPITQGAELNLQYGMIARLDLLPSEPESGPPREPKRAEYVTLALTRSAQDGGLRGRFATASAASRSDLDVGVLQFDSRRIVGGRYRIATTLSATTNSNDLARRSTGPAIEVTDSAFGAVLGAGATAPVPVNQTTAAELRSQATWFSATNTRRYLVQLQARHEGMEVGAIAPYATFTVASPRDLGEGRALSMVRNEATAGARASALIVAPAASVGFDLGARGSLLLGVRADAWRATGVLPASTLTGVAFQPRLGFQHPVGQRARGRGDWATLRGGIGRFSDWPTLGAWSPAWSSNGGGTTACTGAAVAAIDVMDQAPRCLGMTDVVATGRLAAAANLRPVSSTRGELSLSINQLVRQVRADIGIAAARFENTSTILPAYTDAVIRNRLGGEDTRAILVDATRIGADGIVPSAALPTATASPVFAPAGRSDGVQYRLRLATRDVWARTQLEANYSWNGGRQRSVLGAPAFDAPGLQGAQASGNRHTIMTSLGTWLGLANVRATIIARSGLRFTPLADRDLNGDGLANDAAFVPAEQASAWIGQVPASLRPCLRAAVGRIFRPNECEGPWSIASNLFAQLPGRYVGLPRGTEVHLQISNPTSLLAGVRGLGGVSFGSSAFIDQRLAQITGYDAMAQRFESQALTGFGRPVGLARTVTDPVGIAISIRVPLGRSQFTKRIDDAMTALATDTAGSGQERATSLVIWGLPNVPEVFLTEIRAIRLTEAQRLTLDSLRVAWETVIPRAIAHVTPRSANDGVARAALLQARLGAIEEFMGMVVRLRSLLTQEQLAQLEPYEATLLNLRVFRWSEASAYPL